MDSNRHGVCYNMLVNPTGTQGKFQGVDWVEESMINLYTKACVHQAREINANMYDIGRSTQLMAVDLITPRAVL